MPKINGVWHDEQKMQEKLIKLCGGMQKTEELQRIWRNSYPHNMGRTTKEQDFHKQAKDAGFSEQAIKYFQIC